MPSGVLNKILYIPLMSHTIHETSIFLDVSLYFLNHPKWPIMQLNMVETISKYTKPHECSESPQMFHISFGVPSNWYMIPTRWAPTNHLKQIQVKGKFLLVPKKMCPMGSYENSPSLQTPDSAIS